ncbi:MAG: VanZ family protein [Lachnospiraceae bacterium]|nr:VanZ family protein [Lachnospiraceae bacterium]
MNAPFVKITDAYRGAARRQPVIFVAVNIVLVILWVALIMHFSGEIADVSGQRSAKIVVGIINTVAPSANVTLENYESIEALHNSERVVRKLAHMTEYGILTVLIMSVLFGFRDFPRKCSYLIVVIATAVLATIDEKNQTTVEGRYGSAFDVCIDVAASLIAVRLIFLLTQSYRRKKRAARENSNPSA